MNTLARTFSAMGVILAFSSAQAVPLTINGIEFPDGALSFADEVANFSPGPGPASAFLEPMNSLGVPDVDTTNGQACFFSPSTVNCKFTSLGEAGSLAVKFTNNVLTGSSPSGSLTGVGDGFDDLYIVEVGVAEATAVEISSNNSTWFSVGSIAGGSGNSLGVFFYGFDIDKLGFGFADSFTYVRVIDIQTDPGTSPQGADIDAIGAIRSVVPAPGSLPLAVTAFSSIFVPWRRWFFRTRSAS